MTHAPNIDEFEPALQAAANAALIYLAAMRSGPVLAIPAAAADVPDGIGLTAALSRFIAEYEPRLSRSAGSRYWGFVTGGVTPAGLVGDWLANWVQKNIQHAQRLAVLLKQVPPNRELGVRQAVPLAEWSANSRRQFI